MAIRLFDVNTPVINTVMNPIIEKVNENESAIGQLSNPNLLINGDFQVWQRGTSLDVINGSVAFSADRWLVVNTMGLTGSVRTRKLTAISGGESLVLENLGSGSGSAIISQGLEELDVNKLRGKRVTLSYFFNTKMSDIDVVTYARFSETQAIQANGVGTNVFLKNDTGSTTWKKVTQTFDVPVNAKGLAIGIYPQFLANRIGDFLQIRDVKLELGEIATPLSPRPYGEELSLCQRYCRSLLGRYSFSFYNADSVFFCADEIANMRTSPTVIGTPVEGNINDFVVYSASGIIQTGFTFLIITNAIRASKVAHGLTMAGISILTRILLDAEIY